MKRRKNETIEEFHARQAEYARKYREANREKINARERELYAEKKGEPVRQYRKATHTRNVVKNTV